MGSIVEHPELVNEIFLTQEKNKAGIYAIRLFIRGKPWIVTVDDEVIMWRSRELKYAKLGENNAMWGPLLEKAWSKVKGNYLNSESDNVGSAMKAFLGFPVFGYSTGANIGYEVEVWEGLRDSEIAGNLLSVQTSGNSDADVNEFGIVRNHAFPILSVFSLDDTDSNTVLHRLYMMRNPWGRTEYNHTWSKDDPNWSQEFIEQVPFGVDPRTAHEHGIFFIEAGDFLNAFITF
eukprot:CAMPEP_0168620598 /NCGR_PEP_ID=MMETSP0449_2-20121227/7231_1 /TAXON_ID=1082188 /ORGANISM="Strombidium rassoulzadegani, Strain ras09" /LENGTH=232 /DNA_ID=CAMNT_0008661631 /DNA_START=347 /DNA_END=1046 /DNA_ORIENTATION=-